jgi:hypothetical protein
MKRTPLRWVSKRQSQRLAAYYQLKQLFLTVEPKCQYAGCTNPSTEVHHKAGRGRNLCNISTFMAVCNDHHRAIHHRPGQARKNGYLI